MAHFSLKPKFIKESILLFTKQPLKEIFFGKRVALGEQERQLLARLQDDFSSFSAEGGRRGRFSRGDALHNGSGDVFLVANHLGDPAAQSLLILSEDTVVTSGPDLYMYLAETRQTFQPEGIFINIGHLVGTKGGQCYVIDQPLADLARYKYALVYCKQFSVVFSPAELSTPSG